MILLCKRKNPSIEVGEMANRPVSTVILAWSMVVGMITIVAGFMPGVEVNSLTIGSHPILDLLTGLILMSGAYVGLKGLAQSHNVYTIGRAWALERAGLLLASGGWAAMGCMGVMLAPIAIVSTGTAFAIATALFLRRRQLSKLEESFRRGG